MSLEVHESSEAGAGEALPLPSWLPPRNRTLAGRKIEDFLGNESRAHLPALVASLKQLLTHGATLQSTLQTLPQALRVSHGVDAVGEVHLSPVDSTQGEDD